jgi:hypothetical protein
MTFNDWLLNRDPTHYVHSLLRLREQGEFPVQQYNQLFDRQLTDLLRGVSDETQHDQLAAHLGNDWAGYIMRALRRAFGDENEVEEETHRLVIKLLLNPKGLFSGWMGQPIEARFRTAVRNQIASIISQRQARRRTGPLHPDTAFMGDPDNSLAQEFLVFLRDRYGALPASVFQHRLAGGQVKELFGNVGSRHSIKQAVRQIKTAVRDFASGDPEFVGMVEKAFAGEAATKEKRRATMDAKRATG